MLDIYSTEQKVSILTQIMREESAGGNLRDCCKAQGITVQTFIDWKARAQKHNQFDSLHMNGVHPERKPARFRHEKPKTALQLALETAQRRSYPEDNPEDLHALEHGEPEPVSVAPEPTPAPPAPVILTSPQPEPEAPTSGPIIEAVYPIYDAVVSMLDKEPDTKPVTLSNVEVIDMPKATPASKAAAGRVAAIYTAMPWLATLDKQTVKALGEKPAVKTPGYGAWLNYRRALMDSEQAAEMDNYLGINRGSKVRAKEPPPTAKRAPKPAQLEEQKEMVATRANGSRRPVSAEIEALAEQHAHVSAQLVQHDPRHAARDMSEIDKLKRALTALTLENLQLRGLL